MTFLSQWPKRARTAAVGVVLALAATVSAAEAMPVAPSTSSTLTSGGLVNTIQYRDWDRERDFRGDRNREYRRYDREREFRRFERMRRHRDFERRRYYRDDRY